MTEQQALLNIHTVMSNPDLDALSSRAWCLFFESPETKFFVAYDSKDPITTFRAIQKSHPDYRYIALRPVDSQATAIEYAKALRLTASLLTWIHKHDAINKLANEPRAPEVVNGPSGLPAAPAKSYQLKPA